ncbi:hypothetical protein ASPVEDRAFT_164002 [Aspergillus versicolor CBS 583.65]|uniref:Cobalamin-independent methionine synthase MetE C-terminal/archaeal domain-containing protein n=1 Tax=Aspergillus versicolor CBS 583.65 TaxID=1036611 RepID=A0A1L9PEA5_ASPVE|nr:uncharacterized protein ASPVEDRAFT_164002 [Aspergillus versicolor CBS 583.65]OJI99821.1 hypothetical protein ASPVEDRAFT_164002 [Aspergillus versicolor CBS 583.65]
MSPVSPRPCRAEHLGSLLRPTRLLEHAQADVTLRQIEDDEITKIVNEQVKLGFKAVTDGEYRRSLFFSTFFNNISGFESVPVDVKALGLREYLPDVQSLSAWQFALPTVVFCTGKIKHTGQSSTLDEFQFMESILGKANVGDVKVTIPAPSWYHFRHKDGKAYAKGVYNTDDEYLDDLATAFRTELGLLYNAGLRRIQVDNPHLSYLCSPKIISDWTADPESIKSPNELLATYIAWYNSCFRDVPSDMEIGMHICRGNYNEERFVSSGGYDAIAAQLFQDLNVNTFYLEYDTDRAGGFEPLKKLPMGKNVVLGLVSTKRVEMEDVEVLRQRVFKAAEFIAQGNGVSVDEALDRLGVSPQCGFASHSRENRLSRENMLDKLKLVRDLADSIWPGQA